MSITAASLPFDLQYFSWLTAAALFAALALPIVVLGIRSLNWMTPIRRWVIIGFRLLILLTLVLLLGGLRTQRRAKSVEVYCLRDASDSTTMVQSFPGTSLQRSLDSYFMSLAKDSRRKDDDKIGVIGFRENPVVESIADTTLRLDGRAIPISSVGTNAAAAIQMAMATMSPDAMHRILLVWDGNQTTGDLESAVALAASTHIPIDVFPLQYDLKNEIMLDRIVAPSWRRENEPFTLDVYVRSTNAVTVTGSLSVNHETRDGNALLGDKPMPVKLEPGLNHISVPVPALNGGGIHRFHADFTADQGQGTVDTIAGNNGADAFTMVRGKGNVLYVNNFHGADGKLDETLVKALTNEKIAIHEVAVDQVPADLLRLQEYDAIILDNVPRGADGLSSEQDGMLAKYVHDFGGGLVMLGGDQSFGAGGWLGSEVEKILPVDMDIPAERQIPKGALVLIMDPGEIPEGAYWGEQCAIKAIEALSTQDEVGIVDYNPFNGRCEWALPLREKGDGSTIMAAIKKMQDGDLPSFEDALQVTLHGGNGYKGLADSDARQKHIIIISDGDSSGCSAATVQELLNQKISVSTVTAFAEDPSDPNVPLVMSDLANATKGRSYGPINRAPNQLPQIFIKEAVTVRRTLIHEEENGIPIRLADPTDELIHGASPFEPLFGQVLVNRKHDPRVSVPLISGKLSDPILAHWQAGLGKSVIFTGDAHSKWGRLWVGTNSYDKLWTQVLRSVSRAPQSADYDVETRVDGTKGHIRVTAVNIEGAGRNFVHIAGSVVAPDAKETAVDLKQTGPGIYESDFAAPLAGTYAAGLHYADSQGKGGMLMSGVSVSSSPEMRDLHSNDALLEEIRQRTGGRWVTSWDPADEDLFSRDGLWPTIHALPVWDVLLITLIGLLLVDVAARRIAWDWNATRRMVAGAAEQVRNFTNLRRGDSIGTLAALKDVRRDVLQKRAEASTGAAAAPQAQRLGPAVIPNPKAKFEGAKGVEGNIADVVGGARATPLPGAKRSATPAETTGFTESLLDVKRRTKARMAAENNQPQGDGESPTDRPR